MNAGAAARALVARLRGLGNPANVAGMARFGISSEGTLGVSMPALRSMSREVRRAADQDASRRHALAEALWDSGIHEARILAALVDEPSLVTGAQMERWAEEFDSWDVCDQVCMNLFDKAEDSWIKAVAWSGREETFVKRAGFALMAVLAAHDKDASDSAFACLLPRIEREAGDDRNFVKKAVNWALRQIGKRNAALCRRATACARRLVKSESKAARWIGSDAVRELTSPAVQERQRPTAGKTRKR